LGEGPAHKTEFSAVMLSMAGRGKKKDGVRVVSGRRGHGRRFVVDYAERLRCEKGNDNAKRPDLLQLQSLRGIRFTEVKTPSPNVKFQGEFDRGRVRLRGW